MNRSDTEAWTRTADGLACFMSLTRQQGDHTVWMGAMRDGSPVWKVGEFKFSPRRVFLRASGVVVPDDAYVSRSCQVERCLTHVAVAGDRPAANVSRSAKTHCAKGHGLTDDNLVRSVTYERRCRTCHRARSRDYAARARARKRATA